MAPTNDWHSIIAAESHHLPHDAARQLREIGFIVMPGPAIPVSRDHSVTNEKPVADQIAVSG